MEYFFLNHSTDLKVIGKFPQLEKMFDGYNAKRRFEAWGLFSENRDTPMSSVSGFELKYHAKLTDWISAGYFGILNSILISEKFYNLLQTFNCMEYISVDAEVRHRGKSYPYKFLYLPKESNNVINFEKSRFYIGQSGGGGWLSDIRIESYQEYLQKNEQLKEHNSEALKTDGLLQDIYLRELHINNTIIDKDFFKLTIMVALIISQPLKEAMEELKISGVAISPVEGYKRQVWDYSVNPPREVI
ncbi:MAG: hypothetical protein KA138_13355 [Saprospiraceae bacterium]|nr:hypothetical protein [Saprospiraceae bacterium]